MHVYTVRKANW